MAENDIISAYENDLGVTLHRLGASDGEITTIEVRLYTPEDEDFIWALEQARKLKDD